MPSGQIGVTVAGPIARVTLNRPHRRNAFTVSMLRELTGALGELAPAPGVRVVVLAGEGPDFCAGADVAELAAARAEATPGSDHRGPFEEALRALSDHPVPVVARVHGAALGGGCQIAMACDLAVAAEDATVGIPSSRLGIVIPFGSIQRVVRSVGPLRAAELLYTGRTLSGREAAEWGMVNRAVPPADLDDAVRSLAEAVVDAAPLSVRGAKLGIGAALDPVPLDRPARDDRVAAFERLAAQAFSSGDLAEGIQAFQDRRKPRFGGR